MNNKKKSYTIILLVFIFITFLINFNSVFALTPAGVDYSFPPTDSEEEKERLINAYNNFKIKNPDQSLWDEDKMRASTEKDVDEYFVIYKESQKQYQGINDELEKLLAYKIMINWGLLYDQYRRFVSVPDSSAGISSDNNTVSSGDDALIYKSREPVRDYKLVKVETVNNNVSIEFDYIIDFFLFDRGNGGRGLYSAWPTLYENGKEIKLSSTGKDYTIQSLGEPVSIIFENFEDNYTRNILFSTKTENSSFTPEKPPLFVKIFEHEYHWKYSKIIKGNFENTYKIVFKDGLDNVIYSTNEFKVSGGSGINTGKLDGSSGNSSQNTAANSLIPAIVTFFVMLFTLGVSSAIGNITGTGMGNNSIPGDFPEDTDAQNNDEEEKGRLALDVQMQDKTITVGNSSTTVILFAGIRVNAADGESPDESEINAAMQSIRVFLQGPAAEYVHIESEDASEWDEWRRFYIYFAYKTDSEFYKGDGGLSFPLQVPIVVNASSNVKPGQKTMYLKIEKPEDKLVIEPKTLVLADDAKSHAKIEARVYSLDEGGWSFEYEMEEALEGAIENIGFQSEGDKACSIIARPSKIPDGAGNSIVNNVIVKAVNMVTGRAMEAKFTVTVAKEGLTAVSEKPLSIAADGETMTELKITALTAKYGEVQTDFELLSKIRFEDSIKTQSKLAGNAFETAGLEILDVGWEKGTPYGTNTLSCYIYKLKTKREIPGLGENYYGELAVAAFSGEKEYRIQIPVMLDVTAMGPGSKAWEIELDRCRRIIGKIPDDYRQRMTAFLDQRAQLLGTRGLYELRYKIWKVGQTLWEAEGLSGYEDVERWSGYIENALSFANWLGRLATDILLNQYMGVFRAIAAGELYEVVVSAINAYSDGLSFDEWFNDYFMKKHFAEVVQCLGTEGIEQNAEKWFAKNPRGAAMAILSYFAYFFITNMLLKKMDAIEAAKAAAQSVAFAGAVKFFSARLKLYLKKDMKTDADISGDMPKTDTLKDFHDNLDYEKGFLDAKQKINSLTDAIESGEQDAITKHIMDIKSDKYSIVEINKVIDGKPLYSDSMKNTINDVFEKEIKYPTKKLLDEKVLESFNKKGYKDVELVFESKSNKSDMIKVGSDWDVSYKVKYIDKKGVERIADMKAKDLKPLLEDSLYEAAGNKYGKGLSKQEFAEDLLDVSAMGPDAVGGYGKDVNSAINMKNAPGEILNMNKNDIFSGVDEINAKKDKYGKIDVDFLSDNAKRVKTVFDKIKLEDPSSLGIGTGYKELEWFNRSGADNIEVQGKMMEGMKQMSKQYNNILNPMKKITDALSDQKTTQIPSVLTDAVDLFNRGKSPEYIDALLKTKGSSLRDASDILRSQIEAYGKMFPKY